MFTQRTSDALCSIVLQNSRLHEGERQRRKYRSRVSKSQMMKYWRSYITHTCRNEYRVYSSDNNHTFISFILRICKHAPLLGTISLSVASPAYLPCLQLSMVKPWPVQTLEAPFNNRSLTYIRAWMTNQINCSVWDIINYPCHDFYDGVTKSQLKLLHGWVPTSYPL